LKRIRALVLLVILALSIGAGVYITWRILPFQPVSTPANIKQTLINGNITVDEMTNALSENCLAICRIYEPDPSVELEKENSQLYKFFLKYPHMIVYEICKVST
jgi:hypothetical protein